jgi:hypothetical protein
MAAKMASVTAKSWRIEIQRRKLAAVALGWRKLSGVSMAAGVA